MHYYQQNYEPNPQYHLHKKYNIDVSDMPDGLKYFFILPFMPYDMNQNINSGIIPYILTYKQQQLTLRDLLKVYQQGANIESKQKICKYFSLQRGDILKMDLTVKDLKKVLGKQDINGLFFFIKEDQVDDDQDQYIDECAVQQYLSNSAQFGKKSLMNLKFSIQVNNYKPQLLNMKADIQQSFETTLKKTLHEVHKQYGTLYNIEDVQSCKLKDKKRQITKNSNLIRQKIYQQDTIILKVKGKTQLKKLNIKNYNSYLVIYKQGEKSQFKAKYDDISHMKFIDLYKQNLELQSSKYKRDAIYCLKIMDMIIKPDETISKAEIFFKHNKQNPVNIVGKVVNQKMIFYKTIPSIYDKKSFQLNDLVISKDQQKKRQECRKKIEQRAMNATMAYFKNNAKNVQPITLYTSQLKYYDPQTNKEQVIYSSLNKYLRQSKILSLDETEFQNQWKMKYTSTLLKHLNVIPNYKGIAWRGINYDPQISKIGQIVTFKQFTSTSTQQSVAIAFAKKHNSSSICHIFCFKVLSGKNIKQYSFYVQGEILLQPYTQFQVKAIKEQTKGNRKCRVYYLDQVQTTRVLPQVKANFVIWIDDKLQENKSTFDKFKLQNQTTILQQIVSTDQLKKWLNKHNNLLTQPTAKVIFITNMSRKQLNGFNQTAGIDAIKLIRQKQKHYPVCLYIGDIKKAEQKINNAKLDKKDIYICNRPQYLIQYINNWKK